MNAEQRKQTLELIESLKSTDAELSSAEVAALLQELIDAPEAEPVAWMVKNGFVCSAIYQRQKDADNYAADQQKRHDLSGSLAAYAAVPLYAAPPAPSVPVGTMENIALNEWLDKTEWVQKEINTFPVSSLGMHRADVMRIEIERLRGMLSAPTPVEAPADLVQDAKRWRMLPAFLEEFEISYLRLEDAIDAAIERDNMKGGEA